MQNQKWFRGRYIVVEKNKYALFSKGVMGASAAVLGLSVLFTTVCANSISDYKNQINDIQQEQKKNDEQISAVSAQVESDIKDITSLDKEISKYSADLESLQSQIDEINNKIKEYENDLQNSAQKYNSAEDVYTTRLRAIYENGIPNVFDILVSSNGIEDFFSKMNVYTSVLEYDKSLIGNVQSEKEYIDNVKKDIENQKVQVDQLKYDVEKSTQALEGAKSQKEKKVQELNNSKERLQAVNSELQKQAESLDKKVQQEILAEQARAKAAAEANKNKGNSSSGGGNSGGGSINPGTGQFTWPMPGKTNITAGFPAYPDGTKHTGIDIGVPCGTPVYAAQSGLVIKSTYYLKGDYDGSYKDGYGNTVWISDGTYTVIYGHLRYKQVVSEGQYVQKGQLVAYTASTGNSTGPHLHFEIRKNGVAIDPRQFF